MSASHYMNGNFSDRDLSNIEKSQRDTMNKLDKKDSFLSTTSTLSSTASSSHSPINTGSTLSTSNINNNNSSMINNNKSITATTTTSSSNHSNYWQPWEDDILRKAVAEIGPRRWKEIASRIPTRTHVQCMQRWNKVLEPSIKKGSWTPEEDKLLTELVIQNGLYPDGDVSSSTSLNDKKFSGMTGRWTIVSKSIPGRTPKQCRERWILNLDPNINRAPWTEAEDYLLIQLQQQFGNKWSLISKSLPGRTENSVKTRFRSFSRKQQKLMNAKGRNQQQQLLHNPHDNDDMDDNDNDEIDSDGKPDIDLTHKQLQQQQQQHMNRVMMSSSNDSIDVNNSMNFERRGTNDAHLISAKRKRMESSNPSEHAIGTNVEATYEAKRQRTSALSPRLANNGALPSIGHPIMLSSQEQVVTPRRRLTPPMLSTHAAASSGLFQNDFQMHGYPHFHQSSLHYLPNPFEQTRRFNVGRQGLEQTTADIHNNIYNFQQQQQQHLIEQAQQQQHNQIVMQLLQSSPSPSAVKSRTGSLRRFSSNNSGNSNSSNSSNGNENNSNRLSMLLSSSVLFPSNPHFSSTSQYMQSPASLTLADANLGKYLNAATAPLLTQNASSSSLLSNSLGTPLPNILGHKNDAIEWIVRR